MIDNTLLLNGLKQGIYIENSEYFNTRGEKVPRVTDVLSATIYSDALIYWANSLGFRRIKYKDALTSAANIGTEAHKCIEDFLKENKICDTNICFQGFLKWYNMISAENSSVNIIYSEKTLVCDQFGGTLDCLIEINGKKYLVDFKTSNHILYKYFIQLAAYAYMLKTVENINIDGAIILQLNKKDIEFEEQALIFTNEEHLKFFNLCEDCFFTLLNSYYYTKSVENCYNNIFKNKG